jgi:formylmethanofuran dehydrogenase subunit E
MMKKKIRDSSYYYNDKEKCDGCGKFFFPDDLETENGKRFCLECEQKDWNDEYEQ